jgi:hypothetical protein
MARGGVLTAWVARVSASRVISLGMLVVIVLADQLIPIEKMPFAPRALLDEPLHLATAMIVLGSLLRLRGRRPGTAFIWAMLSASVLIDLDHLPLAFGSHVLTAGTPRPYTHALWVVVLLGTAAVAAGRWSRAAGSPRAALVTGITAGAACGVAAHFLRDVVTAHISLWWPVSGADVELPYAWSLAALLVLIALPVGHRPRPSATGADPLPSPPESAARGPDLAPGERTGTMGA